MLLSAAITEPRGANTINVAVKSFLLHPAFMPLSLLAQLTNGNYALLCMNPRLFVSVDERGIHDTRAVLADELIRSN